jgi:hypothetical protein
MTTAEDFSFAMNFIQAIVIAIGLIGNIISIIVFSRKTFRNNSISTYCIGIAIFESLSISELFTNIFHLIYNLKAADQNDTNCKFINYIPTLMSTIQACLLVAFSVDKLLSMKSVQIIKKRWFQLSVVGSIVLFNVLIYIFLPILIRRREKHPGVYFCDITTIGIFKELMIVNLLESGLLPFIIMSITSTLSIRLLIRSRNSVEKVNGKVMKERRSKDKKYAISSITFNIMFIVLKLPLMVFFTLCAFFSYYDLYVHRITLLLYFINVSSSFFVHFATNSLFRREFKVLFLRFGKRNADSVISNTRPRLINNGLIENINSSRQ